VKRPC